MHSKYDEIQEVLKNYEKQLAKPDPGWPYNVSRAINCIYEHKFDQKLTVSWMKSRCRINGHNFSSRFAYYVGRTPKQYIIHHRIEVAKQLLTEDELENMPISTIAYELGFSSASAFSRLFKRKTGMTPSQWREEQLGR